MSTTTKQKAVKVDPAKALKVAEEHLEKLRTRCADLAEAAEHLEQQVRKERGEHEETRRALNYSKQDVGQLKDRVRQRDEMINDYRVRLAAAEGRAQAFEFTLRLQSRYPVEPAPPKGPLDMGLPLNGHVYDGPMTAQFPR